MNTFRLHLPEDDDNDDQGEYEEDDQSSDDTDDMNKNDYENRLDASIYQINRSGAVINSPSFINKNQQQSSSTTNTAPKNKYKHTNEVYSVDGREIPPENRTHFISVLFAHQNEKSSASFLNRAAACFSQSDIIHCEMYFESDKLTCSVDKNHPVYLVPNKQYDFRVFKRCWTNMRLEVTWPVYDAMYQFCMNESGKPFDIKSIYLFIFAPFCINIDRSSWICSRLISGALQYGNVLGADVNIFDMTPTDLKSILTNAKIVNVISRTILYNYPTWREIKKIQ